MYANTNPVPNWLTLSPSDTPTTPTTKEFLEGRYQIAFRRILEMVAQGYSLKNAIKEYPIEFNEGSYRTWIYRDPTRRKEYNLAKVVRADADVDRMMDHADGSANPLEDSNRSKLVVDTLKWRASHDDRETYGDTKRVEVSHSISILQALEDSQKRLEALPLLHSTALDQTDPDAPDAPEIPEILLDAPPDPENDDDAC